MDLITDLILFKISEVPETESYTSWFVVRQAKHWADDKVFPCMTVVFKYVNDWKLKTENYIYFRSLLVVIAIITIMIIIIIIIIIIIEIYFIIINIGIKLQI